MKYFFSNLKQNKYITVILFATFFRRPLYAADSSPPSIEGDLVPIILNIVGLFLAASAAFLIIMIGYGIIKGSLAAGDPRGLEGAKSTWTYAVYGFLVVVLSMVIVSIIIKKLELGGEFGFGALLDGIVKSIESLVEISTETTGSP